MIKSITFISDTPPLKSKGSGISVLLYNMLDALANNYVLNVITFCKETNASCDEIYDDNSYRNLLICDRYIENVYPKVRWGIIKTILQTFSFLLSIPKLLRKINKEENICITVVGASVKPICKAWLLMKMAKKTKHCLYIVDDLELINHKQKNKTELFLINIFLKSTILKADLLITISEGLQQLYKKQFNKDSVVLFPHFKKIDTLLPIADYKNSDEFTFIFTGGLNILYNESLKLFNNAIEEINQESKDGIIYKLKVQTYSPLKDFEKLNFNKNYVEYSTSDNRNELIKIYQQSDCFLVPYSFSDDNSQMVSTSFPQKIAEIIQYGKKVFILGPSYSTVNQFFQSQNLDFICCDSSIEQIKLKILSTSTSDFNSEKYLKAYNENLSSSSVITTFEKIISSL